MCEFVTKCFSLICVKYTQCAVKLRSNFQKIAQLKCSTNKKRNLSEQDEQKFQMENFIVIYRICDISCDISYLRDGSLFYGGVRKF